MWIFHPLGFASVVINRQVPGELLCRSRVRVTVARLFPDHAGRIRRTPGSDYLFRVSVPRSEVAARVAEMVEAIDYGNFKDACPRDRHDPYLRVWTAMYQLQPTPRRGGRRMAEKPTRWDWSFEDDLDRWYGPLTARERDAYHGDGE